MRGLTIISAMAVLFFAQKILAQETRAPTAEECASLYPCPPAKRPARRHVARPGQAKVRTDPDVLRRLQELEGRAPVQVAVTPGTTGRDTPRTEVPPQPVVLNNYVTVEAPARLEPSPIIRFMLELGGEASVHSSWWEVAPGFYGRAQLKLKRLLLGVQSSYERTQFHDGSTVEEVAVEPIVGYELTFGKLHPFAVFGLGYWTTVEDWVSPICGRADCGQGNENSLTMMSEIGLGLDVTKTFRARIGVPVRWVAQTPDGAEWSLGFRAGIGVLTP